ncbi:MAG TPA: hypothetical protein VGG64_22095 [Pirellulales bacterium]|jgi:hypothetical protein
MFVAPNWQVERRNDGAVVVRVPSNGTFAADLPDAVFAFRAGDPQYDYWQQQLNRSDLSESPAAQ